MHFPLLMLSSMLAGSVIGDKLTVKKCICATDTAVGYVTDYEVSGMIPGLGNDWHGSRNDTSARYDFINGMVSGQLCAPGSTTENCKRVPHLEQYWKYETMSPRVYDMNCFPIDSGKVCVAFEAIGIGKVKKSIPDGKYMTRASQECAETCRRLLPNDETVMPLCEITDMRFGNRGPPAINNLYVSRINPPQIAAANKCWTYESGEWQDFKKLKKYTLFPIW
jgi:hypothetical protein